MLGFKVKKILLENEYSGRTPANMTQLAAAMGISAKHLYELIKLHRRQDVERIAKGLGIDAAELN